VVTVVALFELLTGLIYAHYAYRFGRTASRRYAHRAQRPINRVWLIIWSLLWPIWMTMWLMVSIAAGKPLPSLLREPSKAERRKAELARLKEERSLAIQDWQRRASHWYELGQKAEAENDQALKWAVAENLNFLLETKPEGAKVAGLTAPETSSDNAETGETDWEKVRESIDRKAVNLGIPPAKLAEIKKTQRALGLDVTSPSYSPPTLRPTTARVSDDAVSFCNVCSSYRTRSQLLMEGVCRECSAEQGF
jgi:hypothetical protein